MALTGRAWPGFILTEPGRAGLAIFGPYRALVTTASVLETAHVLLSRQCTVDKRQFSGEVNVSECRYYVALAYFRYSSNSTWLDSTRHIRRVEPMHFGCVELVEQHPSQPGLSARYRPIDDNWWHVVGVGRMRALSLGRYLTPTLGRQFDRRACSVHAQAQPRPFCELCCRPVAFEFRFVIVA